MEARFSERAGDKDKDDQKRLASQSSIATLDAGNIADSSDNSNFSGSDSAPSVDNMEGFLLEELQSVIVEQKQKLQKKKKMMRDRTTVKRRNFLEMHKNDSGNLIASQASLRDSIERAIAGDMRSKSQLAQLQTLNHDATIFNMSHYPHA